MNALSLRPLLALACLLLSACSPRPDGATECGMSECAAGQYCADSFLETCELGCTSDNNCLSTQRCELDASRTGVCVDKKDQGGGGGKDLGEGPCAEADECSTNVCVAVNGESYCSALCDSAACPSGYSCDEEVFQLMGLQVCLKNAPNSSEPEPVEEAKIPCVNDASCEPGLICATWMGAKECTLPCSSDDTCKVATGGTNMMVCETEEGQERKACLPNPECLTNPMSCMPW